MRQNVRKVAKLAQYALGLVLVAYLVIATPFLMFAENVPRAFSPILTARSLWRGDLDALRHRLAEVNADYLRERQQKEQAEARADLAASFENENRLLIANNKTLATKVAELEKQLKKARAKPAPAVASKGVNKVNDHAATIRRN
jgi:phage shock protein A